MSLELQAWQRTEEFDNKASYCIYKYHIYELYLNIFIHYQYHMSMKPKERKILNHAFNLVKYRI